LSIAPVIPATETTNAAAQSPRVEDLTPRQIVAELDKFIVGQAGAKRAVAVALRNRYRRARLAEDLREEVIPKNILMIGPTGVGKTEIARRLAKLARAPFLKVEATKFTEVGYVGRDVDSMVRDLVQISVRLVEAEMMEAVQDKADALAVDRIVDILQPRRSRVSQTVDRATRTAQEQFTEIQKHLSTLFGMPQPPGAATVPGVSPAAAAPPPPSNGGDNAASAEQDEREERIRQRLREQVASGARDDDEIEIEVEEGGGGAGFGILPMMGGGDGPGGNGMDLQEMLGSMMPRRKRARRVPIGEARKLLSAEAARSLIDQEAVTREAVARAEEAGIIFIDEIDKVAGRGGAGEGRGPDVSREGVQRDLLPIVEGSTVQTKYGPVRTNHVLFIAAGAFHVTKPSDLIPELQGRLPIRVELDSLNEEDFRRILTEPRSALTRQYQALLSTDGVAVTFTDDAVRELARIAVDVNTRTENIGARRLATVMERLLEELSFDAPDTAEKSVTIDAAFVRERLKDIAQDEDLSRYIL
jgi:ATP-dependent HslUV protease ATP-binding subunit HslU